MAVQTFAGLHLLKYQSACYTEFESDLMIKQGVINDKGVFRQNNTKCVWFLNNYVLLLICLATLLATSMIFVLNKTQIFVISAILY